MQTGVPGPLATQAQILAGVRSLGISAGDVLLVHSSLSSLGWVCGGAVAVIQALLEAVGKTGTVVMPAHSADLTDPSEWRNPPVPASWWRAIREEMPPYDAAITPTWRVGRIPETFRTWPGTVRSAHPVVSFSANGPGAESVLSPHPMPFGLGETSPLGHLYAMQAKVLLLGAGYEANTLFHLAEYRQGRPVVQKKTCVRIAGKRCWVDFDDIALDDGNFGQIGAGFDMTGLVTMGDVGAAPARVFRAREAVDFATNWMRSQGKG